MLIVIEMNVWATVQGIAIAIDRRGPSGRMEMKEGAGATFRRQDRCLTCVCVRRIKGGAGEEKKKKTKQVTGELRPLDSGEARRGTC